MESSADSSAPPTWAAEMYRMMQQQNQRMEALEQQLREQRSGSSSTPEVTPTVTTTDDTVREPMAVRVKKNKLPELSEFSGKRAEFRPWLTQTKAKLAVDKLEETEIVRF